MAGCGCSEACNCWLQDSETVAITGTGTSADPYLATVIPDPDGGIENTADGVSVKLDPASQAPVSLGPDGLRVDCCGDSSAVEDTESINLTMNAGTISGDVIVDPDAGLEIGAAGVGIKVDPDSTADVSVSAGGLKVNLPTAEVVAQAWAPGDLKPTTRTAADAGWLLCDASFVPQAAQPNLFAVIGHAYNGGVDPGDGTFRLPDGRGRAFVGMGPHVDVDALGDNDGLAAAARTPKHTHSDGTLSAPAVGTGATIGANGTGITVGNETAIQTGVGGGALQAVWDDVADTSGNPGTINAISVAAGGPDGNHQHPVTDPTHGHPLNDPGHGHDVAGATGEAVTPYFVGNWMIKT